MRSFLCRPLLARRAAQARALPARAAVTWLAVGAALACDGGRGEAAEPPIASATAAVPAPRPSDAASSSAAPGAPSTGAAASSAPTPSASAGVSAAVAGASGAAPSASAGAAGDATGPSSPLAVGGPCGGVAASRCDCPGGSEGTIVCKDGLLTPCECPLLTRAGTLGGQFPCFLSDSDDVLDATCTVTVQPDGALALVGQNAEVAAGVRLEATLTGGPAKFLATGTLTWPACGGRSELSTVYFLQEPLAPEEPAAPAEAPRRRLVIARDCGSITVTLTR